jgi:Asp-tRNA(Asn)/Glu-tRNA(Gln) amidotransferase A subunit family amidase
MNNDDLIWVPAWQVRELFATRQVSPVEYAWQLLDRIQALNPALRAYLTVDGEQVLRQARDAEVALYRGEPLGPLHGLPISLKDTIPTRDLRTTWGSLVYQNHVPNRDAVLVERLRAAGAIILGKTNTPEFELCGRTVNRLGAECVNPWNTAHVAAGSSGGAGVSVAAGMGPLAIGTDGGGSIRFPAAFNGIFGLIPSAGRVSMHGTPESARLGQHLARSGPMTRDVRDAALIMNAVAGWDPHDLASSRQSPPDHAAGLEGGVRGLRIAWINAPSQSLRWDGAESMIRAAADTFVELGASLTEIEFDFSTAAAAAAAINGAAQAPIRALVDDPETSDLLTPYLRQMVAAPAPSRAEELQAWRTRARLIDDLEQLFHRFDLLLMPTTCFPAPVRPQDPWEMFVPYENYVTTTMAVSVAGACAASVPCGFIDGLPLGLQIIGWRLDEARVLRASRAFERARPWAGKRPPLTRPQDPPSPGADTQSY